jgi:hypothetical protein
MKKRFVLPVVLLFSAVIAGTSGCGAGRVSDTQRPNNAVEEIDPFEYGDEFSFRLKDMEGDYLENGRSSGAAPHTEVKRDIVLNSETAGSVNEDSPKMEQAAGRNVFRVQVGIFEEQKSAERRAEEARAKVNSPVYVEFEPPFYRVRVGDFKTKKEAEEYVKILQDYGFRGSFWVMKNMITP